MFYTVYKITNKVSGKFYIGIHKTKNLNDGYMGSGKYLKYAIKKFGLENFTKEILYVFDTPEQMYKKEKELVNEEFLSVENTYNLKIGGFGGWDYIHYEGLHKKGRILADKIIKEKYDVNNPGQLEHNRKATGIRTKKLHKDGKMPPPPSFKGKNHSQYSKDKIGEKNSISQSGNKNSQYGTIWITNGIDSKKIKNIDVIPTGWIRGRNKKSKIM